MMFNIVNKEKRFKTLITVLNQLVVTNKQYCAHETPTIKISKEDALLIKYYTGKPVQKQNFFGHPISIKDNGFPEIEFHL